MSDESNPGTPLDNTADTPVEGASESVQQEGREASEDGKQQGERVDWKAMALGLKATLEERNRREAEPVQQQGAYPSPTDPRLAQTQAEMLELRAAYAELQQEAAGGDRRALLNLKLLEDQMMTKQEIMYQQQLGKVAAERRDRVWDHFQKNRHRFATIDAADESLEGIEARALRAELEQKKRDAEAILKAKAEGVQGTHGSREVGAAEAKVKRMTVEQYDQEIDRLRAEGNDAEAMKLMGLVRGRKVILTG